MGRAIDQVERQKRRLLDAYLGGVLELPELERKRKELDGRSNTLLAQKRQLEASANERIELAKIADSIEQFCKQVKEGLSSATSEQKRTLVELLIDQVVVTDEEVEIRYVIPTSPEGPHLPFCHLRTDYLDGFPRRNPMWQQAPGTATAEEWKMALRISRRECLLGLPAALGVGR
jgi:site-specific DNA recombinase